MGGIGLLGVRPDFRFSRIALKPGTAIATIYASSTRNLIRKMSNFDAHEILKSQALARDLAKLRAPKAYPQSVAARMAPKPSFLARLFGAR